MARISLAAHFREAQRAGLGTIDAKVPMHPTFNTTVLVTADYETFILAQKLNAFRAFCTTHRPLDGK